MFDRYSVFAYKEDNVKIEICFFFYVPWHPNKVFFFNIRKRTFIWWFFFLQKNMGSEGSAVSWPQFSNTCLFLQIIIRDDDLMMSHALTRSSIANGFQSEIKITSNGNIHGLLYISTQHFKIVFDRNSHSLLE